MMKIQNYRRIKNSENFFLCSAICSVGKALGSGTDDYGFYANFTGDNFAYMYAAEKGNPNKTQCDSGITNYFFNPPVVSKAFAAFGYECVYISNKQIKKDPLAAMNAIKASVGRGVPVLAWGMGGVITANGSRYDPLPEACLIGGCGENDLLYVNLYLGPERLPIGSVDEFGYSAITHGLESAYGLFFAGNKTGQTDMRRLYQDAINSIPIFLTFKTSVNSSGHKYAFGKTAFETWAATLVDDSYFSGKSDEELGGICWNLHCSPYCCICTGSAHKFLKDACEKFPDLEMAAELLPLYKKMLDYKNEIWSLHGGFYPPMEKFRTHEFRLQIAEILRSMGGVCDDILKSFGP